MNILRGYIGEGEGMLRRLFADARRLAPCLVFVDEFQAVFADESSQGSGLSSASVSCLDDVSDWNANSGPQALVTVIAATNEPWAISKSFLRSGRLERLIYVGPLDDEGKAAMLKHFIRNFDIPFTSDDQLLKDVVTMTANFTGADMNLVLRRASSSMLELGTPVSRDIVWETLHRCISEQRPSVASHNFEQYERWLVQG